MKKMENFFRRALSMLMCICMLTGNVGGALAEVPTPLSDNNASLIATSEENSVVNVAMKYEGITLQGYYDQTLPNEEKANASAPYAAYYLIDVSVAGIMQEAKIAFNHGFDADGAPVIELRPGDATTAVSWVDGNIVLQNDEQLASSYTLLVGVPLKDSAVANLLEGGSVTSTLTASNSASETIALNPQVSLTQEVVTNGYFVNPTQYNKWTLTYTCDGIRMYNTGFTAKVDNGTIYDYGETDTKYKLTTTACGVTIQGRQSKTDLQTLVFDHETDYRCVSCFDTNFKAEFYSSAETTPVICSVALQPEKVGVEWDIAASSAASETVYKSGKAVVIDGEKCIQWTIKVDNVAKGKALNLVDALTETELLVDNNHPFVITGQKNETQYAKDNNDLRNNSITTTDDKKNLTVTINREMDGVGTVVVTYYTSVAKTNVNKENVESYFEQNTANIQNAATLNSVDVSNNATQKITSVNAKVNDNVKTLMVTLKTQNKTDGSAIEIKTNEPNLYIAALDASGKLTKPVKLEKVSGSNSEFKAGFMYEAQNGTEPVVLLPANREKDSDEIKATYVKYNNTEYKPYKLSDILYLDVDGDGSGTAYPRDFFAIEEMTESNGALNITLTNDEQTGLEGLAEAYKGNLYINTVKDEFTKHTHTELPAYYDDTNYLGVAGNFHIVAFGKAELNTHCNGNILAHELVAGSNFGTNGYPFEVSYIQKYSGVASTSASSDNHLLVLGSYNDLSLSGKNDELNVTYDVNGKKIDTPDHIMIDVDTDTAPFIDLAAVESEIESRSSGLLGEDGGVSVIASNASKRYAQFILNSPDSTGYLNLTAGELNAMSDLPVRLEGFKGGHVGTMVINVNCAGVGEVKMPSEACIFVDGVQQGTGEVTVFTNGRVIWNFYNEENTKITTSGAMTGMIVAPQATIDVAGNVNGTVVGHNIKVTRESHRTDFKGTITSAVINFSARKYVDNQDPGDKKFTFVLEEKLGDEWTKIAETTNNGTSITFPDIEYSKTGEHEYRIREEATDGYVCDKSEYYICVKVTSTQVGADTRYWPEYTYYSDENHQNKLTGPESFRFNNQTITTDNTKTSVRGKKVWDDNNNADGVRPAQVEIVLLQDGVEYARTYANQASSWQWSFVGLPKSTDGQEHVYTVSEMPVGKYTTQITKDENSNNEFTITNTHRSTKVSIDVTKRWEGDNTHPANVVIKLYKYDVNTGLRMVEPLETVTLDTTNNWHHQFTDLPKFENNIEIRYEVVEDSLEGYDTEITLDSKVDAADGSGDVSYTYTVKNTYTGQKTVTCRVGFKKIWKGDDENQRPTFIEVTLKRWTNGVWGTTDPTFKMTQTVTKEMGWEYYWENLPMYVSGDQQYYYYVEETPIPNYKVSCYYGDANSHGVKEYIEMTNTYQQSTKAELHKVWGNENADIPNNLSLHFKLYREANGTKSYVLDVKVRYENGNWVCDNPSFATIKAEDNKGFHLELTKDWSGTLPMDDGKGNAYTYTFEEDYIELNSENLTGTYQIVTEPAGNVTTITNTAKTIAKKDVTVTKEWEHGSNPEEYRPTSVQVTLKRWRQGEGNDVDNNFSMGPVTLSKDNWSHTWTGLEEGYLKGDGSLQQYYYFVEETGADGYKAEITRDADNIYNLKLKNTYDDSKKKLTVEKVWVGDPGSYEVWVELRAKTTTNGDEQVARVSLNNNNGWSYQWTDLPTVVNNQVVDYYYVKEISSIYGYTTTYGGDCVEDNGNYKVVFGAGNRANVTITNTKMEYVTVKLNKVWDDAGFEGERPYRLEFELWRKTENGTPERLCDNVAIYCDNGTWKCQPDYATFSVNDNGWSFEFSYYNNWDGNKMPANDANNNPYTYYFVEKDVKNNNWKSIIDQYEVTYEQNNNYETTVTNQRGDKTVDIPVVKVWNDTALPEGQAEHADITLQLVANGTDEQGKTIVLPIKNEDGTIKPGEDGKPIWSYTFEDLPEKDADKNVITYTVREIDVPENYVVSYGIDDQGNLVVTNTYVAPVEAQIEATKTLTGKTLENGEFSFQLYSDAETPKIPMPEGDSAVTDDEENIVGYAYTVTNGEYVSDAEKVSNPNDWQKKVVFPYISYKLSDMKGADGVISTSKTFTYSIREIPGGESNIIYDETSYDVKVTVGYDSNSKELSITSITYDNAAAKPEFKNTYVTSTTAQLSATKELTGKQLTAGAFTFELAADIAGAPMPINKTVENDANGNITFGDITYTLSDMKESDGNVSKEKTFTYTIKEQGQDGNGITIDKTVFYADVTVKMGDDGKLTASAPVYYTDVENKTSVDAKFTNTYETEPAKLTISVDKKLDGVPEGQTVDVAGKFTFTLSAKTENAPMPANDGITAVNRDGENSFGEITFNAPGTYTYTVTETGEVAGVVNGVAKEFTFTVEDDGMGNLFIEEATGDKYTVEYTNTYEVRNISVTKEWEGRDDGKYPVSVQVTLNADGVAVAGEGITNPVTLNEDNQWSYTWSNLPKYAGSTREKEIEYTVVESELAAGYTGVTTGNMDTGFTITNTYGVKPIDVSFPVKKELKVESGTGLKEAKNFTFELSAVDGAPVPATTTLNINLQSGVETGEFGPITYTAAGTYTYTIKETSTVAGVTNDADATTGKTVTVTVVDNGDGTLTATADSTEENPVTFTNTYNAGPAEAAIAVKKVLVGVPADQPVDITGMFTFQLKDADGNVLQSKQNAADGSVTFDKITYDTVGTYTYTVTESGDVDNISNDTTVKTVTVTVEDNGDGTMTATADSTAVNPFEFTNTYVEPIKAELKAKKTVTGEGAPALEADQFTFELYEGKNKIGEAKNADDGTVTFELEKEFTLSDAAETFTYTIKESSENAIDGFKYDESVWTAEVEISLTSEKKLDYVVTYSKNDGTNKNQNAAEFVNQYEKTELSGKKIWDDENNQYQNRPVNISVDLYRNNEKLDTVEPELDNTNTNEWTWTIKDLDKYVNNEEVSYSAVEVPVTGYTTTQDGNNFTNTLNRIDVPVEKKWEDDGNSEGFRPAQIQLQLVKGTDKTPVGQPVTVTADGNGDWKYTFEDLPEYENRQKIVYSVVETEVAHYDTKVERDETTGALTVTNSRTPEKVTVAVKKVWDDAENQDGERPTELKVTLSNGQSVTLNAGNKWEAKIENLPKYADGKEIVYTWTEDTLTDGYQLTNTTTDDLKQDNVVIGTITTLTNKRDIEKTEVKVVKVWSDNNDQDGLRPKSISVQLLADGENVGEPVELNESNSWSHSFGNLDVNKDGVAIVYSVKEISEIAGYTTSAPVTTKSQDGKETTITITNTHETAEISIEVVKEWADADNQDGIRDTNTKVTVQLTADGKNSGNPVELSEANNWTHTFEDLPAKADGEEIEYAVVETAVPKGYTVSYSKNGTKITVTNTHTPETTEATVKKVWSDANNQDGKRPTSLVVTLSNGQSVTLNEANKWTGTITGLPKYAGGQVINYTWTEATLPEGYTLTSTKTEGTVTTLTNSYTPELTEATVTKVWDDADDQDDKRPEELTVTLSNGQSVTLNEANLWTDTITGLPKYAAGQVINYTWTEDEKGLPEGYTLSGTSVNGTITTLTNSYTPETTEATVKKVWDDANDQDGIRPDDLTVTLSDGQTVTLSESNNWTGKITGLPKYAAGEEIVYTWSETDVPDGYELTGNVKVGTITTITNKHTPELTEATVKKVWDDANDQDGIRPDDLTVTLSNGQSVTLNEGNGWTATVKDLPKYAAGQVITYTWTENEEGLPEGYTLKSKATEGTITTLTNSYTPETTEATVKKVWDDANDQDGIRPDDLTVTLSDGQTVTLSESNNWTGKITGLPKYAAGVEIVYTWTEGTLPEGYKLKSNVTEGTITTITNTHETATTEAKVIKVWEDDSNRDHKRPETLTVTLSNGQTVTLSESNHWTDTITGLPKYAAGEEITYTWTEDTLPKGYTLKSTETVGTITTITNSYTIEKVDVAVKKEWDDNNNQDGMRTSIEVELRADSGIVENGTATLTKDNNWSAEWKDLPKYNDGVQIVYTVAEKVVPDGYTHDTTDVKSTVDEDTGDVSIELTNHHVPETTEVEVTKVWNDAENQDGKRPTEITYTLWKSFKADETENTEGTETVADGEETKGTFVESVTKKDTDDSWDHTFVDLPVYEGGKELVYTVTETVTAEGYKSEVTGNAESGFTVTNSYTPETTEITATKVWDDASNQDGKRPDEITFELYANGEKVAGQDKILSGTGDSWTVTWTGLDKYYDGGKPVVYTVKEIMEPTTEAYGYEMSESEDGLTITNTYKPETVNVSVIKDWQDNNDQDGKRPETLTINLLKKLDDETAEPAVIETVVLPVENSWSKTWENLPKYENRKLIIYTVEEVTTDNSGTDLPWVADYDCGAAETISVNNYKFTNTHAPEKTFATVTKVWDDADNQDGKRPTELKVTLSNGTEVTLNEGNGWTATVNDLPMYADGKLITYTWTEGAMPEGYSLTESKVENGTDENGISGTITTITNSYSTKETSATIRKVWDDSNDQDGLRPKTLVVTLSNGTEVTLNEENHWTATIDKLPMYADGELITYTWTEGELPEGYELTGTSVNGTITTLTNTHTPEKTEATVVKVWDDKNDQDGKRPKSLEVTLSNGTKVTLDEGNKWTAKVENLPKYKDGVEIAYTWTEEALPEGYELTNTGKEGTVTTLTNSYVPEQININVVKVWDDAENQDGKRPDSIYVQLYANGEAYGEPVQLTDDKLTASWTGLDKCEAGTKITYTVKEGKLNEAGEFELVEKFEGYTATIGKLTETNVDKTYQITITNKHIPELTSATVKKVWDDADDQDGKRPDELTVTLSDGTEVELNEGNGWSATIENLPKYADGKLITYTWTEEALPKGYTLTNTTKEGTITTLTNSHTPEETEATVVKVWDDAENQDGKRPTVLTVTLSDGTEVELNEGNGWTATVENLPKYADGEEIEYTWTEGDMPEGYELTDTSVNGTITTLTNSYDTENTVATVKKVWNDKNNQDGIRPKELKVTLSNGTEVTLNEGNGWSATVEDLPKYANGQKINYTWTESGLPEGYELTDTSVNGTITTLTNTHETETTEVRGTKEWVDGDDQDKIRPERITVKLLADGQQVKQTTVEPNESGVWSWEFTGLDKFKAGKEIVYTVTEETITGYELTQKNEDGSIILINTHAPAETEATVKKVWDDATNQDGKRPDELKVTLSNGTEVTLNEANSWTATVEHLPKYNKGVEIEYTWTEGELPEGYELTNTTKEGTITTLTNSHTPELIDLTIIKVWNDGEDQDGMRPEALTVTLKKGTEVVKTITLNEGNSWTATVKDQPMYENGVEIEYTWTESALPEGYELTGTSVSGYVTTLTNTHVPAVTEATVLKVWEDAENQDGKRPTELKVTLSNGTEVTLNEGNKWTATINNLPMYADGELITYTWTEGKLPEGYELVSNETKGTITTITNKHDVEMIQLTVKKVWDDAKNQDGKRPNELKVNLSNGTETVDTVTLNQANLWTAYSVELPKYADGKLITYTWTEVGLPAGYTLTSTVVDGTITTLTNSHVPEKTEATVIKIWDDANDQDGKRPDNLTVTLKNGDTDAGVVTLNEGNNWTGKIDDLPKYANGTEIQYTWSEGDMPDGYELTGSAKEGTVTTLTNSYDTENTAATVKKVWNDANDQDGLRPESLEVTLSNGTKVTLNEENQWTATINGLPKFANGTEIQYSWTEGELPKGYTLTGTAKEGTITTLTNTHVPEITEFTVTKVWDDAQNQDGIRPTSILVQLYADGDKYGEAVKLEGYPWSYTWNKLPKNNQGEEIVYTVNEVDENGDALIIPGYTKEIEGGTITNTHEPVKTSVKVTKIWSDSNNQDGIRPEEIAVQLLKDNQPYGEAKVLSLNANNWTATWTDLPKLRDQGTPIVYTVVEGKLVEEQFEATKFAGYTTTVSDDLDAKDSFEYEIINTHTPGKVSISGTKTWDDADNQDGIRPTTEGITINLLANGTKVKSETVYADAKGNWSYSFTDLPEKANGQAIAYTITEDKVEGYETTVSGYNVTNKHTPETIDISGTKTWEDAQNQDGIRPGSITINLLADGIKVDSQEVTEANGWKWSFTGHAKYKAGQEINYTITEEPVSGYTPTIDGFNVTNTHTPGKVTVSGTKTWDDAGNQDGKRPGSITIRLLADGKEVRNATVSADNAGNWSYSFTDLPEKANGQTIVYTITEDAVTGYDTKYDGYNVTNTHKPEKTKVEGSKTWEDAQNQDGKRPGSITINLLADGTKVDSKTVTEANEWKWSFTDLDKYANGEEIVYTITEEEVAEYTASINGYNVTNTHTPEKTKVEGSKTWDDAQNQDGKRPGSITINLLADGTKVDSKTVTAADGWKWSFTELDKYADGDEIVYTITEDLVTGYETDVDGYNVTNTHEPEKVDVEGSKTWNDVGNQDGKRPGSITINLLANGTKVDSQEVTEADGWKWSFTELDKYADGEEIVYTITEDEVEYYKSEVDGYNVTNTHEPEKTKVEGSKTWNDAGNQDGKRPASITINLLADGTKVASKTVTEDDEWKWSFTGLAKYKAGKVIAYTITEDAVTDYTTKVTGYDVENSYKPGTTSVTVSKSWNDDNNRDGVRPASITFNLLANGTKVESKTVTEADGWKWSFTDLPIYEVGKVGIAITYTVTEDEVKDYTTTFTGDAETGFVFTNTHINEKTKVEGSKTWNDNKNQDGKRPASITINLLADGEEVDSKTVTEADSWKWSFTELNKYRDHGVEIVYTITEDEVEYYESEVDGYDVTNTHEIEKVEVSGSKTWEDAQNQDGKRPASITIRLLANGTEVDSKTVTEADEWKWSFTELDKYADGEEIEYTITEDEVEYYESEIDGYNVTNTHEPEKTKVEGNKTWNDAENQDGKRPGSITINLLADGEQVKQTTVEPNESGVWSWEFTGLDKYKAGKVIAYTITEEAIDGYELTQKKNDDGSITLTNTHTPAETEATVKKVWDDAKNQDGKRPAELKVTLSNGTEVTLNEANSWTATVEHLPKYNKGVEIEYTWTEGELPEGYTLTNTTKEGTITTLTNTHVPEKVDVEGSKTWNDAGNQDGKRPASITINLLADGTKVASKTVTKDDEWKWSFTGLDKYKAGTEIAYTITEDAVADYETEVDGYDVTNTHVPEKVDVEGIKTWNDANNQDGKRPESIKIHLLDGETVINTVIVNDECGWKWSFTDLPKFANGTEIQYSIVEELDEASAAAYSMTIDGYNVTNTHEIETVDITGAKTWIDLNDKYLKRPDSVTIRLLADGEEIDSRQVTEADNWSWTFKGLPKYKAGQVGQEINYSIKEDVVTGYITTVNDFNVTNTMNLVEFIKTDEQTGKRLPGAKFALYEGPMGSYDPAKPVETWVSTADTKILAGLKVGQTYTIVETEAPSGYAMMVPFQFTVQLTDIPGTYRAFSVSNCHVYRFRKLDSATNGLVHGAHLAVMDANNNIIDSWWSSGDNNGWHEIVDSKLVAGKDYKLVELESPWGYELADPITFSIDEDDGMLFINGSKSMKAELVMYDEPWPEVTPTPEPTETSFTVTKSWEDQDNVLGLRPSSITVHLYRKLRTEAEYPTMPFMTVQMASNGTDTWRFTFDDLPRRSADGVLYDYTVQEVPVDGYVVSYRNNGKTIVNSIPEEDFPPTPTPTLPYVTPTPSPMPRVPAGVQFVDGEWMYIDEYGIPLGGIPLTGDNTNFVLWGMAIGLPLLVAALAAVEIRRRKKLLLAAEDEDEVEETEA